MKRWLAYCCGLFLSASCSFVCWGQEIQSDSAESSLASQEGNLHKEKTATAPAINHISESQKIDLQVISNKVTANLDNNSLYDVLDAISKQSKIKIQFYKGVKSQKLTDQFMLLPMEQALKRLLGETSYIIKYKYDGADNRIIEISILPRGLSSSEYGDMVAKSNENVVASPDTSPLLRAVNKEKIIMELESGDLPDDIRVELLSAVNEKDSDVEKKISDNKEEVFSRLIQQLDAVGAAKPETIQQLEQSLQQIENRKAE